MAALTRLLLPHADATALNIKYNRFTPVEKRTITFGIDSINDAAKEFIANIGNHKVFAFYGKMGAGKTTFIKALCEELGVTDVITSPTFALVNEYTAGDCSVETSICPDDPIYHFDFYRIKKIEEVYDMGYEEYFYSDNLCLIEWPELIEDLLPDDAVIITITANDDETRSIRIE